MSIPGYANEMILGVPYTTFSKNSGVSTTGGMNRHSISKDDPKLIISLTNWGYLKKSLNSFNQSVSCTNNVTKVVTVYL